MRSAGLICHTCGRAVDPLGWRCPCGGLLDVLDTPRFPQSMEGRVWSLWRYLEALPESLRECGWEELSMGEGMTPLVPLDPGNPRLLAKLDFVMPTMSFKDRGAAVLIAHARSLGVDRVVADSSGNAGTAIAAYAARAGIAADVFIPEATSAKKVRQIVDHGATVHRVPGTREDTAAAAIAAVEDHGLFYASHVYNPFFYEGTKTFAFELWEQLGGRAPASLVLPVGNGTLVLGAHYGFRQLHALGLIDRVPRILCVQSERCAPLAVAFQSGSEVQGFAAATETLAEGIAIAMPARGAQIVEAVRSTGGSITVAAEADIAPARAALAALGLHVEPTAAAVFAALRSGAVAPLDDEVVVMAFTGGGLKSA